MKVVYKILNNQIKVTMKHFYHIRCDPDLGKGFCSILCIPCTFTGCVEKLFNRRLPNRDKPYNHIMLLNLKNASTLPYYVAIINGILPNLLFKKKQKNRRYGY